LVTIVEAMSVIPDSDFGTRVRDRLRAEAIIWLVTTGADGTPQPNPVWFLWEEPDDTLLVYNRNDAARLAHVAVRPRVAAHLNCTAAGGDVVIFTGVAEQALDAPPPDGHEAYVAKYAEAITRISGDPSGFAAAYSVALRIRLTRLRGF
jgi:PPOX class probable F420-dependent enzyme